MRQARQPVVRLLDGGERPAGRRRSSERRVATARPEAAPAGRAAPADRATPAAPERPAARPSNASTRSPGGRSPHRPTARRGSGDVNASQAGYIPPQAVEVAARRTNGCCGPGSARRDPGRCAGATVPRPVAAPAAGGDVTAVDERAGRRAIDVGADARWRVAPRLHPHAAEAPGSGRRDGWSWSCWPPSCSVSAATCSSSRRHSRDARKRTSTRPSATNSRWRWHRPVRPPGRAGRDARHPTDRAARLRWSSKGRRADR